MIYEYYQSLKSAHPNAVVLMKLGDFYQAFDQDAQTVATVTTRTCRQVELAQRRVDTCCVPAAQIDAAIEALLQHGYQVAVAQPAREPEAGQPVTRVASDRRLSSEVNA